MSGRCYLVILAGLACGAPGRARAPAVVAPWLRADPQRCLIVRDLSEGMEIMARRCAKEFVRQNGYTEAPATGDSSRWVFEPGERGPLTDVFGARRGSLEPTATTVQCAMRQCLVLFRLRHPVLICAYRAVSMTHVFTRIRLEAGAVRDVSCAQRRT